MNNSDRWKTLNLLLILNLLFLGCSSNQYDAGITFHKLPSNRNYRESWLTACNSTINPTLQPSSSILICSKHFKKSDFQQTKDKNKRLLKQGVVPSQFPKVDEASSEEKSDAVLTDLEGNTKDTDPQRPPRTNRNIRASNSSTSLTQADNDLEKQVEQKIEAIKAEIAANTLSGDGSNSKSTSEDLVKQKPGSRKKKTMQVSISSLLGKHYSQKKKKILVNKRKKESTKAKIRKKVKTKKHKVKRKFNLLSKDFTVGTQIQAQDVEGVWRNAYILEVDTDSNEILVRFKTSQETNSSNKSMERIPMNSARLRRLPRDENANDFAVGDKVMAKWNDSRKFPATIQRVINDNMYEVLFDDGYVKTVRANCMNKIKVPKNQSIEFVKAPTTTDDYKYRLNNVEIPFIPKDGEWSCYWINDSPVGKEGFLDMPHGILNTIIVDDWRLPKGWTKHLYQRTGNYSGKWDTILENNEGKTFRNKNELKLYLESRNIEYDPDVYDFCLHKKRAKDIGLVNYTEDYKVKGFVKSSQLNDSTASNYSNLLLEGGGSEIFIGSLKVKIVEGLFVCPSCEKTFRKEKHLQIHVKHYHLDIADLLGSVPNMQEIASFRTVENDNTPLIFEKSIKQEYKSAQLQTEVELPEPTTSITSPNRLTIKTEVEKDQIIKFQNKEPSNKFNVSGPSKHGLKRHLSSNRSSYSPVIRKRKLMSEVIEKNKIDKCYVNEFGEMIKIVRMRKEEVINCICAYAEEDGLMIQCELCLCWQHGFCNGIVKESQVPDKYVCIICRNPERLRVSMRFIHDQDWLYDGKLYSADYHVKSLKTENRNNVLKHYHTLNGNLFEMDSFLHSLDIKLSFVANKLHPKLYLWSKTWENTSTKTNSTNFDAFNNIKDKKPDNLESGSTKKFSSQATQDVPVNEDALNMAQKLQKGVNKSIERYIPKEEAIDSSTCQLNLLTHIQKQQNHVFNRLQNIEAQIKGKY